MSSFEWARSSCAWCHPGGGNLEYDRAGYRYDGRPSGLLSGTRPNIDFNPNRDNHKGDYYTVDAGTLADRKGVWVTNGVAEVDCLMCHLNISQAGRYANLERNITHFEPGGFSSLTGSAVQTLKGLKFSATMGLSRTSPSLITDVTVGANNVNPVLSNWKWAGSDATITIPGSWVTKSKKENCAICHFPDRSWAGTGNLGPIGSALGFTSYQKIMLPGTSADPDECTTINALGCQTTTLDGRNDGTWTVSNGRVEGAKRVESLNDPTFNPDVHLNKPAFASCSACHYNIEGNFGPKKDKNGNIILPAVTDVQKIDHQFAKGDAFPDTKNMDQFDYTVTCESCHITRTHPNHQDAKIPQHAGLPAIHLNKIACKTCHIPVLNGPVNRFVNDYSVGGYRGMTRSDAVSHATGVAFKPLYLWQERKGGMQIVTANTNVSLVWIDGSHLKPTFQRLAVTAANNYRTFKGDSDNNGVYDFALNRPHGTLPADHIAVGARNTGDLIALAERLNTLGGVADPILNVYINYFSISHNVQPIARDGSGKAIPGPEVTYDTRTGTTFKRKTGPLGINGCIECHSSSNPNSPNYSPLSVGFFDKSHLFIRPVTGGIKQAEANIGTSGNKKRVRIVFGSLKKEDGTSHSVDLSSNVDHGVQLPNTVSQADILGYSPAKLAKLTEAIGTTKPQARLRVTRVKDNPATTDIDESARGLKVAFTDISLCPSGTCTKELKVGTRNLTTGACESLGSSIPITEHTFSLAAGVWKGNFCAQLSVTDTHTGLNSTRTFPINLTKRNTKPTLTNVTLVTPVVDRKPRITFTVSDDDDTTGQISVLTVWGHDVPQTVAGNAGEVTKTNSYPNVTKTYNVRITAIDTKGGRTRVTVPVTITATSP